MDKLSFFKKMIQLNWWGILKRFVARPFVTFLLLFLLALGIAAFVHHHYTSLVEKESPLWVPKTVQFNKNGFEQILEYWQKSSSF